jgi:hypothetical protein
MDMSDSSQDRLVGISRARAVIEKKQVATAPRDMEDKMPKKKQLAASITEMEEKMSKREEDTNGFEDEHNPTNPTDLADKVAGIMELLRTLTQGLGGLHGSSAMSIADVGQTLALRGLLQYLAAGTLLKVKEVAAILGYTPFNVYHLIRSGQLEGVRVGPKRLRVTAGELRRFLYAAQ